LYTLDAHANVTAVQGADGSLTTYTYTPLAPATLIPAGLIASETTELGTTIYNYSAHGLLASIVEAAGTAEEGTLTFHYNTYEDLDYSLDELNRRTDYEYDALHRLTKVTLPAPATGQARPFYQHGYNKNNQLASETDPLGRVTLYDYNSRTDLSKVTQPARNLSGSSTVTTYGYDQHRRLTSVIDPRQHETDYGYDAFDQQTTVTEASPDGVAPPPVSLLSHASGAAGRCGDHLVQRRSFPPVPAARLLAALV